MAKISQNGRTFCHREHIFILVEIVDISVLLDVWECAFYVDGLVHLTFMLQLININIFLDNKEFLAHILRILIIKISQVNVM